VVTGLESPRLEVGAVGAGDELAPVREAGEPSLQIIFHRSGIIKRTSYNIDHSVGQFQCLVKTLTRSDELLQPLPRLFRVAVDKLLDFLELMDSENSPDILPR
jgi:hypothetical protein